MATRSGTVFLLIVLAALSQGCAQKAKAIKVGAAQFEVESLAAVDRIDGLRVKETSTTLRTSEQASKELIELVQGDTDGISLEDLRTIVDPAKLDLSESESEWQSFLADIREQHTTFTAIFASLEKGSFLARESVKEAVPYLDKLVAQLVAFAQSIKASPPEFTRQRAELALDLETIKGDPKASDEVKRLRYLDVEKRLRSLGALEAQTTKEAIEQSVTAAKLGVELKKLLLAYDQLSLDDINEALTVAFKVAGHITGFDLSEAQAKADQVLGEIRADSDIKALFDNALQQVNAARSEQ
ncbi:MAG: hypothetical protein HYY48_08110 [Gammaproteobacteria bacterium]|nr:hypothetical protein [Gammaproteobacteria bacterium]